MNKVSHLFLYFASFLLAVVAVNAQSTQQVNSTTIISQPKLITRNIDVELERKNYLFRQDPKVKAMIAAERAKSKTFENIVTLPVFVDAYKAFKAPAYVPTWTLTASWIAECDAAWNETCRGFQMMTPPAGYDYCLFSIVELSQSHGRWSINEAKPTGVKVWLESAGSQAFFDQWSGWVKVQMTSATLVLAGTSDADRITAGCSMTNGASSAPRKGISENLFCLPTNIGSNIGTQMCQDYIYDAGAKKADGPPYACGVCILN